MNATATEVPATEGARTERAEGLSDPEPPPWSAVLRTQLRLLLQKKWKLLTLLALAIAVQTFGILSLIPRFGPDSALGVTTGVAGWSLSTIAMAPPVYGLVGLIALFWAASVWSDEGPGARAYHWSLPVRRPVHDLTRVGAGALLFMAAALLAVSVGYGIHVLGGANIPLGEPPVLGLTVLGIGLVYLLGAIPTFLVDHPIRWTVGTVLGYLILGGLLQEAAERWSWLAGLEGAVKSVWNGAYGLEAAFAAPPHVSTVVQQTGSATSVAALLLWLCLAAVAVVSLSLLHLERAKGAAE